jgi:uncharacterized repeat protein (TIGR03803 family)
MRFSIENAVATNVALRVVVPGPRAYRNRSNLAKLFQIGFMLGLLFLLWAMPSEALAQFSTVYSFGSSTEDGKTPVGSLTLSGSTLYGMTASGGAHGHGTIFRIEADGSGYQLLHSFGGAPGAGDTSLGGHLAQAGPALYGATYHGGAYNFGGIFRADKDGVGYRLLHSFWRGNVLSLIFKSFENEGIGPHGLMALSGSSLYGTTEEGGLHNMGTIFRIDTDSGGYHLLHRFGSVPNDGMVPVGLTLSGSTLYGATAMGGPYPPDTIGKGTIFRIDTDGGGYRILYRFGSFPNDGASPHGLILSGSTLYGTTGLGGEYRFGPAGSLLASGTGTIFRIGADGGEYRVLHAFPHPGAGGAQPAGPLTLSGSTLYGMTGVGGAYNGGAIFRINTDGSEYQVIHSFDHGTGPSGFLTLAGTKLYGITVKGGVYNSGAIFSFDVSLSGQGCPSPQPE